MSGKINFKGWGTLGLLLSVASVGSMLNDAAAEGWEKPQGFGKEEGAAASMGMRVAPKPAFSQPEAVSKSRSEGRGNGPEMPTAGRPDEAMQGRDDGRGGEAFGGPSKEEGRGDQASQRPDEGMQRKELGDQGPAGFGSEGQERSR